MELSPFYIIIFIIYMIPTIQKVINVISMIINKLRLYVYINSQNKENVKIERTVIFNGLPIFKNSYSSIINISKNCLINSSINSNVAGVSHPCIFATIGPNAEIFIGENVGISGASIVAAKSIRIGANTLIGAGSKIWDSDFHSISPSQRLMDKTSGFKSKSISIGENVFIGASSIILKGVSIGNNSVIGAGSVVVYSVEENSIYAGNPAVFIRKLTN
jgi:acetyltransferase-like isoleucine patch superfamily enzyme